MKQTTIQSRLHFGSIKRVNYNISNTYQIVIHDKPDMLEYLVKTCGVCLQIGNNCGTTALHLACELGCVKFVHLLLNLGAEVGPKDHKGYTPLHITAQRGNADCMRILLAHGASMEDTDLLGKNVFHMIAEEGQLECLVTLHQYFGSELERNLTEAADKHGKR